MADAGIPILEILQKAFLIIGVAGFISEGWFVAGYRATLVGITRLLLRRLFLGPLLRL